MSHVTHNRNRLLARTRRLRGQVEALEKALAGEADCMATLTQIAAIRGAAQGLMLEILDGHLQEHIAAETDPARRMDEIAGVQAILRSYFR